MEPGFEAFTVLIARLSRSVKRLKTGEMAEFDLKGPHVSCLYYLSREEGLTAVELCERCDEDKAAISRSLDFLEKNGYISCDSTARKRYRSPLRLTDKGRAVCRRIGCPADRLAPQCAAAEENRRRVTAVRGVYVVTCLQCGAESRYFRRGAVVQALEEQRGGIRCRRCGGRRFRLEKRYEKQEDACR